MNYLIIGRDHKVGGFERRQQTRAAHLESSERLKKEGKLLYAVAILEEDRMVGSVMIINFQNDEELQQWKISEPYITGNVWEEIEIKPCAVAPMFRNN